jgi:hypothetical protein
MPPPTQSKPTSISRERLLDAFLATPAGKQLHDQAERAAEQMDARRASAARLAQIRAEASSSAPVAAREIQDANTEREKLRVAFEAADAKLRDKIIQAGAKMASLDFKESRELAFLRQSASPAIDQFQVELTELADETRQMLRTETRQERQKIAGDNWNPPGIRTIDIIITNKTHVLARLAAIKAAKQEADRLRELALAETELLEHIEGVRQSIPAETTLENLVRTDAHEPHR